jgi:transposase
MEVVGMEFRELRDEQWELVQPLLPPRARTGRPRAEDRRTLNGILYVLTTGCRWMDMPREYGSYKTAWRRLKEWQEGGVWEGLWQRLLEAGYRQGEVGLEAVAVDATTVEAKKGGGGRRGRLPAAQGGQGARPGDGPAGAGGA